MVHSHCMFTASIHFCRATRKRSAVEASRLKLAMMLASPARFVMSPAHWIGHGLSTLGSDLTIQLDSRLWHHFQLGSPCKSYEANWSVLHVSMVAMSSGPMAPWSHLPGSPWQHASRCKSYLRLWHGSTYGSASPHCSLYLEICSPSFILFTPDQHQPSRVYLI